MRVLVRVLKVGEVGVIGFPVVHVPNPNESFVLSSVFVCVFS